MHRLAAQAQMTRINQAIAASKSTIPEPRAGATQLEMRNYKRDGARRIQQVIAEVHLYFVSWAGCRNMLKILVGQPEFLEAKKVFDSYRSEFEHYVAGRNSFEHFHDRLPGSGGCHRVRNFRPTLGQALVMSLPASLMIGNLVLTRISIAIYRQPVFSSLKSTSAKYCLSCLCQDDEEFIRKGVAS